MPIIVWLFTGFFLIILSVNSNSLFFLITGLLAFFLVIPFWLALLSLKVQLTAWPTESCSGDPLPFVVRVSNHWPLPLLNLELELYLLNNQNQRLETLSLRVDLTPFANQDLNWAVGPLNRGVYQICSLQIKGRDPFGLLSWTSFQQPTGNLQVYPALLPLSPHSLQGGYAGDGMAASGQHQAGMLPDGIRNYTPGDSLARIHWKATANLGNLVSKSFAAELASTKVLLLAYWGAGQEDNEAIITAGASLAWAWFQQAQEFYFLLNDQQTHNLGLIRTPEALRGIMEHLMLARPGERAEAEAGLVVLLDQAFPTGAGQIILLTDCPDLKVPPNWQQAGWETVVVVLSPELSRERIVQILEDVG